MTTKAEARLAAVRKFTTASKADRLALLRRAGIIDERGKLKRPYSNR